MAYAALISVFNAIKDLLESPRISITSSTREILQSANDQAWLRTTLGHKWCGEVAAASDREQIIIEEARRLQDAIEFAVSTQLQLHQSKSSCNPTFSINLYHLKQDVHRFAQMAENMKGHFEALWENKAAKLIEQQIFGICRAHNEEEEDDVSASASATDMIGLRDVFHKLRDTLAEPHDPHKSRYVKDHVIWIDGMAGVGKTTFAKRVYEDPLVKSNFECWAFVRVGPECWQEPLLRSLNAQLNHNMIKDGDYENIRKSLHTTLKDKKFLIVFDDVWDEYFLDSLSEFHIHENQCRGERILVTSRKQSKYIVSDDSLKLRFLNEGESWELLKRKVFGEQVCPPLLVEPGKKIALKCGGLPLLINTVAPLLLEKADNDPEIWNQVAEKPIPLLEEATYQISEVLLSSYNELDEIYKFYFLYLVAFPQSYIVYCSTINNLWRAEGLFSFIVQETWGYTVSYAFYELVNNNLVIEDHERSWSSHEIKAGSLHCAYWYLAKRVAKKNRFLYVMSSYTEGMEEVVRSHHRLAIQFNVLLAIKDVLDKITSVSTIRSVLCTGPYQQYQVPICFEWKMLRVLDTITIRFYEFPAELVKLVLLRYLAVTCNANLPPSISRLWNLRYLIVRQHLRIKQVAVESFVPVEVWHLQELIHLEIMGRNLPEPPHPGVVLPNLARLLDVGVESCTKRVLSNIPKLWKLRIQIELAPDAAEYWTCFSNIRSFQCVVMNPTLLRPPPPLSVPNLDGIRKLSLSGFGYPWEEMSKIGKLQHLRVLKLQSYAFRGEKWEINEEMRFKNLEYLYIEDTDLVQWTRKADKNMRFLCGLKMKNCHKLHEIPELTYWNNLKIELIDCNPLAETCAKERNRSDTLYNVTVTAAYSWKEKKKLQSA